MTELGTENRWTRRQQLLRTFQKYNDGSAQYVSHQRLRAIVEFLVNSDGADRSLKHWIVADGRMVDLCIYAPDRLVDLPSLALYAEAARHSDIACHQIILLPEPSERLLPGLAAYERSLTDLGVPPDRLPSYVIDHKLFPTQMIAVTDGYSVFETPEAILIGEDLLATLGPVPARDALGTWTVPMEEELPAIRERQDKIWKVLSAKAVPRAIRAATEDLPEPYDPLWASADHMAFMARLLCQGSLVDDIDCEWYHGAWQYLRLADKVSSPSWHEEFFFVQIRMALLSSPQPRLLIAGAADYALFGMIISVWRSLVAAGLKSPEEPPEIWVVDACSTPLHACRWLANWERFPKRSLKTVRTLFGLSDIVPPELEPGSFDAIFTDAFLTRFSKPQTGFVLNQMHSLLRRPHGRLVTTVRCRNQQSALSSDTAVDYAEDVVSRLLPWRVHLKASEDSLLNRAMLYAERMQSTVLGDAEAVTNMFSAKFRPVDVETAVLPGELERTTYVRVIVRVQAENSVARTLTPEASSRRGPRPESILSQVASVVLDDDAGPARDVMFANGASLVHACRALCRGLRDLPLLEPDPHRTPINEEELDRYRQAATVILETVREMWSHYEEVSDGLPCCAIEPAEIIDFRRIHDRMVSEDHARNAGTARRMQPPAQEIDLTRAHATWMLGMLIGAEADALAAHVETSTEHLDRLLTLAKDLDASSGLYPARISWITARVLLGIQSALDCYSEHSRGAGVAPSPMADLETVEEVKNAGGAWLFGLDLATLQAGTGNWNEPVSATVLSLLAAVRCGASSEVVESHVAELRRRRDEWLSGTEQVFAEAYLGLLAAQEANSEQARSLLRGAGFQLRRQLFRVFEWVESTAVRSWGAVTSTQQGRESSEVWYVSLLLVEITTLLENEDAGDRFRVIPRGIIAQLRRVQDTLQSRRVRQPADPATVDRQVQQANDLTELLGDLEHQARSGRPIDTQQMDEIRTAVARLEASVEQGT